MEQCQPPTANSQIQAYDSHNVDKDRDAAAIVLLDKLKQLWRSYLTACSDEQEEDEEDERNTSSTEKQNYLEEFLFNFQFVDTHLMLKEEFKSFFNQIPEEICSYLLESVYEIISKSDAAEARESEAISKENFKTLRNHHNFAQLILKTHHDCNNIIALRTFLTDQLGQHLLQFLQHVDIKLIASQRSLCNLCTNLFPNCTWTQTHCQLHQTLKLNDILTSFTFNQQRIKSKPTTTGSHRDSLLSRQPSTQSQVIVGAAELSTPRTPTIYAATIADFQAQRKTSDEIAHMLIGLLKQCVYQESDSSLSEQSMTIIALNFALNALQSSNDAINYSSEANASVIKYELLHLIQLSCNNLFANEENSNAVQFPIVFAKLTEALHNNDEHADISFALIFFILSILYNLIVLQSNVLRPHCHSSNGRRPLHKEPLIDQHVVAMCMQRLLQLQQLPELTDVFVHIFKTLLRISAQLSRYECCMQQVLNDGGAQRLPPAFRKKYNLRHMHCKQLQQQQDAAEQEQPLSCFFQHNLLQLLPLLHVELQEYSMRHLLRTGICCCHYTLDTYASILQVVLSIAPQYQKCAYKFLQRFILSGIFLRSPNVHSTRKRHEPSCLACDEKLKSRTFQAGLLKHYKQLGKQLLDCSEPQSLELFLKHLKRISHLLPYDIAAGIIAEIVLPIFRAWKSKAMPGITANGVNASEVSLAEPPAARTFWHRRTQSNDSQQSSSATTSPVKLTLQIPAALAAAPLPADEQYQALRTLNECLNICAMYLCDIRLVKAFYNEENIRHLEDLLSEPELIRGICDLIKIGIDNITFLGDNAQEQLALSRRLITLQLNSSDRAAQLFNGLLQRLAAANVRPSGERLWLDAGSNASAASGDGHLNTLHVLHITALQWSLNYDLLKTSQLFYNEFAKTYSIVMVDEEEGEEGVDSEQHSADQPPSPPPQQQQQAAACDLSQNLNMNLLKHGDKTIIDILKLNYNALCCFLMLPPPMPAKIAAAAADKAQNSAIDCAGASSSLEAYSQLSRHPTSLDVVEASAAAATFLEQLTADVPAESNVRLFDLSRHKAAAAAFQIEQQQRQQSIAAIDPQTQCRLLIAQMQAESPTAPAAVRATNTSSSSTTTTITPPFTPSPTATHASHNSGIIENIFHIFGWIFGGSRTHSLSDLSPDNQQQTHQQQINEELACLYQANGDCKKLLLKLFEATMAICIKGYQNEEVEKMQKHLRKLKAVILNSATENWQQHAEEQTRDNTVIQTLQTLLKIAELSSSLNEPGAVVSSSVITTATDDERLSAGAPHPLRRARSTRCSQLAIAPVLPAKNAVATPPTPRRPLSGDSADADYFSTRASIICPDSELELSDNNDDFYLTADEGYEADGEVPDATDTDGGGGAGGGDLAAAAAIDNAEMWTSFQPASRYRTHVLHEGLCRLVIELLIELSTMCTRNPKGWCESLTQLANRLFIIRDCLGGPLFLLRGFQPVLASNDIRLKELQQSLLELISDLNSPDVLTTFFSILGSRQAPVDILIKYMHFICSNTLKRPQPYVELEFPVLIDGKCISTADEAMSEQIDRMRNYHLNCSASTPFTRSPLFIPIKHARLWHSDGLTVSLWFNVKSQQTQQQQKSNASSQLNEEDTRSASEDYMKTHLVSLGTNQAMLSVYVNNNMNLVFEACKPNAEVHQHQQQQQHTTNTPSMTTTDCKKQQHSSSSTSPQRANPTLRQAQLLNPETSNKTKHISPLRNFLQGISQMHIFNGHHHDSDSHFDISYADLKHCRLAKNRWTHLTFAVDCQPDRLDVTIYIDGLERHIIQLPFRNFRNLTRTHVFQMVALGDGASARLSSANASSYTESRSTLDPHPLRLSVANLMLFNRKLCLRDCMLNLTAMGPDFVEFTQCQVGNWKPNYGYLNLSRIFSANFGSHSEAMRLLKHARILSYTAQQPDIVMCYDAAMELDNASYGKPYGLILYGELIQNQLPSLQTATILSGGLSSLVYLFARVVEASSNSATQSMALDLLLRVALSESQLYTEFQRNDYISLIGYVIKSERCTKDVNLLKSIINNACSHPVISRKGEMLQVSDNTIASIVYPRLIISVLHRYSDWHRSGVEHSDVLDILFAAIIALTREKHPHRDFNMEQLTNAGLLRELLNICKVYVIESPNPVYISRTAAVSFVQILSIFAGSPPTPFLMDEVMKLLLLLHRPSDCYITHDLSKFYFLLTAQPPYKEKSDSGVNLSRVAAPLRRSLNRKRPGQAVPVPAAEKSANDLEAERRAERIQRLRKLHSASAPDSSYKRAVHEFEENLENIADCSKLNKNALRLLSPIEAARWRLKYKRHISVGQQQHHHAASPKAKHMKHAHSLVLSPMSSTASSAAQQHSKITRKRLRLGSANSLRHMASEKRMRSEHNSRSSMHSLTFSLPNYESGDTGVELASSLNDVFSSTPIQRRAPRVLLKTDFYKIDGIVALQERLLLMLKDFLCLQPDNTVDEVLKHFVKVEFLLVLANHSSCSVRTAIVKLLSALTVRLPQQELQLCFKNFFPLHLANQLAIHASDEQMLVACFAWLTGAFGSLETLLQHDKLQIQQRFAVNPLLATLTKATAQPNDYAALGFQLLQKLYIANPDEQSLLMDAGLLQCCIKALYNLYAQSNFNAKTELAITQLLTTIAERSLMSVGQINIVWDILNLLSFYQSKQPLSIVLCFRSVQALLQLTWMNLFFAKTNVPWRFRVAPPPNCTLTLGELKTRLDLLVDRCTQFFTVFDATYTPSINEIRLFEQLVSYCIATNQRCNNFIAWGLQPSRPRDLRAFIIDALWISCEDDFLPSIICDGKMIKSLLWLCLLEDLDKPIENLQRLCKYLGITENVSTWNLENELERIKTYPAAVLAKQKSLLEKTVYKMETLAQSCIESSMVTTRRVAELQNAERKLIMSYMKDYDDTYTYAQWVEIIRRMSHEGAPWYNQEHAESSWELDDTEGPSRVHTRLRRCHLDIDKRFFMEDFTAQSKETTKNDTNRTPEYTRPLEYLVASYDQQLNVSLNSQILYNFTAKYLPVDGEIDGEIIITDHKLYFLATYRCKYFNVNCDIANIAEIWLKRYQHQEKAFEIFLDTNKSLFFSLQNQEDWKKMRDVFCDKIIQLPDSSRIGSITQQWRDGLLTNWEYLMTLNQIAGRTYNDLMQYPVFPWILSDYTSKLLDLSDSKSYRKLEKPIAVQNPENEQHYINNYMYINSTATNMGSLVLKPYHYSSHYSNSGTVLHFLVRVPPFTSYFLRYQDNNFDLPDRTFHALSTTWSLASRDSPTDVKELIPEFFCLPEMFENYERFNFGCRQSGERVEDVLLPPWCLRDSRLFVLIHRQALESELVRNSLHNWIDLIFGYKQTGESAVDAINVFHPATYSVFLESEISDPIERKAVETMVKTYGQMPRQLFKYAHPATKALNYMLSDDKPVLASVRGLRWGVYVGSPQLAPPSLGNLHKLPGAEYLVAFGNTNVVYGLPARSAIMQGAEADTYNVISWGYDDRIVRIEPLNKLQAKPKNLLQNSSFDDITACGCDSNSNQLWFGHKSGRISVYKCTGVAGDTSQRSSKGRQSYVRGFRLSYNSAFRKITSKAGKNDADVDGELTGSAGSSASTASGAGSAQSAHSGDALQRDGADLCWQGPTVLVRHTDEITCITLSVEYKIAVTAGRDGIAVIWDLNDWSYVRTIESPPEIHRSPITLLAISPTLGDIVTVHAIEQPSVNGSECAQSTTSSTDRSQSPSPSLPVADECFEVTEENLDDFVNVAINPNGKSILRLHTVNARYVQRMIREERILAVCYSYIKEGVGVNVIATAIEGGIVRLWSSWCLSFVSEIVTGLSNIKSITYSTHQHLVVLTKESHIQVWETEGLYGNSPKFPQIAYK